MLKEFWTLMEWATIASLVMSPVHTLFGLHIVRRGVIFIDLAVAQVAALGTAFALAGGFEPDSTRAYWMSLLFGLVAALVIAVTRFRLRLVPHEAIIGIIFVVGSAWSIIVLGGTAHGLEEMQSMLVGSILTVDKEHVRTTAFIYGGIVVAVMLLWRAFTRVTLEKTDTANLRTVVTDFIFYSLLAFVVASSVKLAGVLLVFTWLVMPAVAALFWSSGLTSSVLLALPIAVIGSLAGLWVSFGKDWPTGATMVVVFGAIVGACYILRLIIPERSSAP